MNRVYFRVWGNGCPIKAGYALVRGGEDTHEAVTRSIDRRLRRARGLRLLTGKNEGRSGTALIFSAAYGTPSKVDGQIWFSYEVRPAWALKLRNTLEKLPIGAFVEIRRDPPAAYLGPEQWALFNDGEPQRDDENAPKWADDLDAALHAMLAGWVLEKVVGFPGKGPEFFTFKAVNAVDLRNHI